MKTRSAPTVLAPAAFAIPAALALDPADSVFTLRCIGCSAPLAGVAHLGVHDRFGATLHYCSAACRSSFGVAK